jgi:predicted membrane protein
LFEGDFDFNAPGLKPAIAYAVEGATGTLKVSQGSVSGSYENAWRLNLDDTTPLDLEINMGAGDADLVLGRLNLDALDIQLGAGDVVIDLRGMPARSYRVKVQAGAGDTTVRLPAGVGVSARTSGFIGDTNVSGLEQRDGRWINARAAGSPVTVDLDVQHAIGDLRISAD